MLCLKVANNATNNYQTCQSLYDFIMLSLCKTSKEPKRVLNNKVDLINKAQIFKKSKRCFDCKLHLNLEIDDHRSSSLKCPLHYKNWRFHTWDLWKKYLTTKYSNIEDDDCLHIKCKISMTAKDYKKRDINDLLIFHSIHKDTLQLVRHACNILLFIK